MTAPPPPPPVPGDRDPGDRDPDRRDPDGRDPDGSGPDDDAVGRDRPASARPPRRVPVGKLVVTPLVLAALLLATWLWIRGATLDPIERASLGGGQVRLYIRQSIELTAVSTVFVLVIAIPAGILLTRRAARPAVPPAVGLANLGQATPAIGLLALLTFWLGIGQKPALVGMVAYAVLPVLSNTMTGLRAIDPALLDAARGIGMSPLGVLTRVELPLAVPLILAGVRTALVLNVGTSTLAAFVSGGGLGNLITNGILTQRTRVLIVGSVLAVTLALLVDWLASIAELRLSPRGLEAGR
ncbi:ABC transporter permease [Streptomyces sp. NPDC092296]|uniref:ABC transporter permease n=1 Tax=Streptomyces sp. NPDC092296 TaxID=3366012 RepID=UPI00382AF959